MKLTYTFILYLLTLFSNSCFGSTTCGGSKIGKLFIGTNRQMFNESKTCCESLHQNLELYRISGKSDMGSFAAVLSPFKKQKKSKTTFWVNGVIPAEQKKNDWCTSVVWSTNTNNNTGENRFSYKLEKCSLQHVYLCRPRENPTPVNSIPTGMKSSSNSLKVTVPILSKLEKNPPQVFTTCHLAPLQNGLYVSSEKMNFYKARSCCLNKGLKIISPFWTRNNTDLLQEALSYPMQNLDDEIFWILPMGKSCFGLAVNNANLTSFPTTCYENYRAICENRAFNPDTCQNIRYASLQNDSYILSDGKATNMEAEVCCRQKNKYLFSIETETESKQLYNLIIQQDIFSYSSSINFWTGNLRGLNSTFFPGGIQVSHTGPYKEFCITAVAILGKEDFLLTDVACEQRVHFICKDMEPTPGESPDDDIEDLSIINKRNSIYPTAYHFNHV